MEVHNSDSVGNVSENLARQAQLKGSDGGIDVPKIGEDNLNRITQSSETYDFSGTPKKNSPTHPFIECPQPGVPPPSVDNTEEAGVDCTREPHWEVVESKNLPEDPQPSDIHNDKYWDERSLDNEIREEDYQETLLNDNRKVNERSNEEIDEYGRPYQNEVLDPYYQSTVDPPHHNS